MEQSVTINGTTYVISDTEWVTLKRYCELFGTNNTATIENWIKRGIVPEEDCIRVPHLNNIRLVRAKQYQEWYPPFTNEENEQTPIPPRGGHTRNKAINSD